MPSLRCTRPTAPALAGWCWSFQPHRGTLANQWLLDPAQPAAGAVPILALELQPAGGAAADLENPGAATGAALHAFLARLDWAPAYLRYQQAVDAATEHLGADPADVLAGAGPTPHLIDVRRAGVFDAASSMIAGATWRDPALVGVWGAGLAADLHAAPAVLVYCVYGHEVGRSTALRLHAAGVKARYLRGGIDGWAAAGLPLVSKVP